VHKLLVAAQQHQGTLGVDGDKGGQDTHLWADVVFPQVREEEFELEGRLWLERELARLERRRAAVQTVLAQCVGQNKESEIVSCC
jgi:hypothetical protein